MPLYTFVVERWQRCLRCAKRCSLLRGCLLRSARQWTLIGVLQRSFNGKSSSARIWRHLLFLQFCVIWIIRDSQMVNIVSQTMNKHNSLSWIIHEMHLGHRQQSLCCLEMQNTPWRHWRTPSIYLWKDWFMGHSLFCSWLRPGAVSRLRARWDYKVAEYARNKVLRSLCVC